MSFLQQLIQLLSRSPDSIVYHIVMLLTLEATLGLTLAHWRRQPDDRFTVRLAWAAGGILFVRLAVIITVLVLGSESNAVAILPPLERAVDTVTAAFLVWALVPQPARQPRLGNVILVIGLLVIGFLYAFAAFQWQSDTTGAYAEQAQATLWEVLQILVLFSGAVLVFFGRESQWHLRLTILAVLLAAHLATLLTILAETASSTDIAYWVRLGNLVAFPLLAVLTYRHSLSDWEPVTSPEQLEPDRLRRGLELGQEMIHSMELDQALRQALGAAQELLEAKFTGLALLSPGSGDQVHLVSMWSTNSDERSNEAGSRFQTWALNLSDWPGMRLALEQHQQVELLPSGLGARQLFNFYEEVDVGGLGALLIDPMMADGVEIGLLLSAGNAERERWSEGKKEVSPAVAGYLAQALYNAREFSRMKRRVAAAPDAANGADEQQLAKMARERDQALSEVKSMTKRWESAQARFAAESRRVQELSTALAFSQKRSDNGARVKALEAEIEALRESLMAAEEAMAMAAAGTAGLSTDWVMRTVTRYSGELEEAQGRINELEARIGRENDASALGLILQEGRQLRTPLTSLGVYTDLLLSESLGILGSKQISLLERMKSNIEQLTAAVDHVAKLAKLAQPEHTYRVEVESRKVIETAADTVTDQLRLKGLKLNLDMENNLPPVLSDDDGFYQVVVSLLNNACQVSPAGGRITVEARVDSIRESGEDGEESSEDFLNLSVTDSGGVESQRRLSLVTEAQRDPTNPELQAQLTSSGRSLATALSLVNGQGGRIWLEAAEAEGSTITVLLPINRDGAWGGD